MTIIFSSNLPTATFEAEFFKSKFVVNRLIKTLSFFKILKIARISRFGPFVQKLTLTQENKATLKIF